MRATADGVAIDVPAGQALEAISEGWYWLHFGLADQRTHALLKSLPVASAANLIEEGEDLQQILFEGALAYGTIADLQRGLDGTRDHSGYLHFIMADDLLITARRNSLYGAGVTRQALQSGNRIPTVDGLLEAIMLQIVEGFDRRIELIADEVNRLEDRIIAGIVNESRASLGASRRTVVRIHRHLSGLRTMLQRLRRENGTTQAPPEFVALASRVYQQSEQLDHEISSLRERTRLLQEEVAAMLTEETNKHLRVLSILTILFMPPTFIGGLFGMNLKGIPFANSEHGFLLACVLAAALTALVAWLLKKSGILGRKNIR
jgi:zinc transporter